jgi:ATP-dependent Lhr-like helicase
LEKFGPATRSWFESTFQNPTAAQSGGWEAIGRGDHTLIHAPTGSGKTLAAFLWSVDRLLSAPVPDDAARCRVLYISPMKALAYDIERNLRSPLAGIRNAAGRLGIEASPLTTALRTGDTPQDERRKMARRPPDILLTTPESLFLLLTSQAASFLASVQAVIIDEVHAIAGTKRGAHLALSLERLEELTASSPQRIGLSATQRPLEEIGRFLAGGHPGPDGWEARPVSIVDAPRDKPLRVEISVPVKDMTDIGPAGPEDELERRPRRSIWPHMYPQILEMIRQHRSTIVFTNSRGQAERIANQLNELAEEPIARAHHGSVSRTQRLEIEDALKRGTLPAVVATATLELGIDMEAVELVILVEAPPSVASGLQRVGRAGHQVGAESRAKVFPKHRGDLLEAAVVVNRMLEGSIESTRIPTNPLDVLAQQVVAHVAVADRNVEEVYDLVRRAAPFSELARGPFEATLDMLAGRYPSDAFAELRPRLVWDRVAQSLTARPGAKMLAVTNAGTIPDRGLYRVVSPEGGRVGELDEEMVYESRSGDTIILGSSAWQITEITQDRVVVVPAPPGSAAQLPFWHGDAIGRPLELGRAVGAFIREMGALDADEAKVTLQTEYHLDEYAAANLAAYVAEEQDFTGALPTDRTIVVQRFRDEIGDWRMVLLSPFGSRVHAPWAMAASARMREERGFDVDTMYTDDGIIFRFPDSEEPPDSSALFIPPEELGDLVVAEASNSALFTSRFREAAGRALLLPRRRPGERTPLWLQRRKAVSLLEVAKEFPTFPIVLETYREVLQDYFDIDAFAEILTDINARKIRVRDVETDGPSPFASSLMFDFVASYMYEYDAPLAERRAAALTLDRNLLSELMGEPELRQLLDADSVNEVELSLQWLTESRSARSSEGVRDMLLDLGPLTTDEVSARSEVDAPTVLAELEAAGRVIQISSPTRWAAIEDAARLRDALGVALPQGIPQAFLEPIADPLGDVVGRFARTHGPFTSLDVSTSLGLPIAIVEEVLGRLEANRQVERGAFRPGGAGTEWVNREVLRRLRRRSLAKFRDELEPVEHPDLARFLLGWHAVGNGSNRITRLQEIVTQLQGTPIPASILERDVLAARMEYRPDLLDQLMATGEVVWIGRGALGSKDGRVALYYRDQVPLLHLDVDDEKPSAEIHGLLRERLRGQGASFFRDLYEAVGGGSPEETLEALWDLVWAGEVTNDTLAPLRALMWGKARSRGRGRPRMPSVSPPAGSGRWYLVDSLVGEVASTERAAALATMVLERHGVVARTVIAGEGIPGGFTGLYSLLAAMEDTGKVRRGYFVEGLGGAQFAYPGVVDRLRASTDERVDVLAAADPANPYGSTVPWPESSGRPSRSAGAYVILVNGELAVFVERGGRRLVTFVDDPNSLHQASDGLRRLSGRMRRMEIETIDGDKSGETQLGGVLKEAGFRHSYKGLRV